MLPFGLQTMHAFEHSHAPECLSGHETHIDNHHFDCEIFHLKIDTESYEFTRYDEGITEILFSQTLFPNHIDVYNGKPQNNSSRAPPSLVNFN